MIETVPAIINLIPNDFRPSVNECTSKSITIKNIPTIITIIPTLKNTLNNDDSLSVDILFHQ
jgi:hypothetical protein